MMIYEYLPILILYLMNVNINFETFFLFLVIHGEFMEFGVSSLVNLFYSFLKNSIIVFMIQCQLKSE